MRKFVLVLLAMFLFMVPSAHAGSLAGKVKVKCTQTATGGFDPINGGADSHQHAFFGNTFVNRSLTTADLMAHPSTCRLPGTHSLYWAPRGLNGAGNYSDSALDFYYAGDRIYQDMQLFPQGLKHLSGEPHSTQIQNSGYIRWRCNDEGSGVYIEPPLWRNCDYFDMEIDVERCWDGANLDSANHKSHLSFAEWKQDSSGNWSQVCPSGHGIAIPQVQAAVRYVKPAGGWDGWHLSSDEPGSPSGSSAHIDAWHADESVKGGLWMSCLNDPQRDELSDPNCGTFTWDDNPWSKTLNELARHLPLYINSDASPNWNVYNLP
jgi:hypothetical protein